MLHIYIYIYIYIYDISKLKVNNNNNNNNNNNYYYYYYYYYYYKINFQKNNQRSIESESSKIFNRWINVVKTWQVLQEKKRENFNEAIWLIMVLNVYSKIWGW